MRLFTVHFAPDSALPDQNAVFVKLGFNWPAFLFRWVWAFATGLWLEGIAILLVEIMIGVVVAVIGLDPVTTLVVALGWYLVLGTAGNDLRRWNLRRRGSVEVATVAERNRDQAERRFFEQYLSHSSLSGEVAP